MKYIKRQLETVDAVEFTGVINDDLVSLLSNKEGLFYFELNDLFVYNKLNKPHHVLEGEVLVCYRNGLLDVVAHDEFYQNYRKFTYDNSKMDMAIATEYGRILLN